MHWPSEVVHVLQDIDTKDCQTKRHVRAHNAANRAVGRRDDWARPIVHEDVVVSGAKSIEAASYEGHGRVWRSHVYANLSGARGGDVQ